MSASPHAPELTIPVHDLDAGGKELRLPLGRGWLKQALEGTDIAPGEAPGELDLRISKSGTDVVIHGELRGELVVPCARCLEPAKVVVREPITALAVPTPALREGGAARRGDEDDEDGRELADEDEVIPYDGETVVLDDLVRDELVLAIPMIPLCSETCPGIAGIPEGNRAEAAEEPGRNGAGNGIDPRLRPLLALKKSSLKKS